MRKIPNINTHIFKQPDIPWAGVSAEAQAMLDNYELLGVALSGDEKSFMIAYVDAEVASGNHTIKDNETIYSLAGVNGLVDYIGGKVSTAINAPTHNVNGYVLDSITQYIKTNFDVSTDATNYTQNNASYGGFLQAVTAPSANTAIYGNEEASNSTFYLRQNFANDRVHVSLNAVRANGAAGYAVAGLEIIERTSSANVKEYRDGVLNDTVASTSASIASRTVLVGSNSIDATLGGTVSSFMIGGALASNPEHNTNLRALLTGLGATLP